MIVIGTNASWGIEVRDQIERFGRDVGARLQASNYAQMAAAFGMASWRVVSETELAAMTVSRSCLTPAAPS